jgi:hypothetical protein
VQLDRATVVVDAIDDGVRALPFAHPCEDVHFVAPPLESGGQLGDLIRNSANADRMQSFPGQKCNVHRENPSVI